MRHNDLVSMIARGTRSGLALFFFLAAQAAGLVLWVTYVMTWIDWWGGFGLLVGVLTMPGLVIFPFLYWIVENQFPWNYFALWAAMIVLGIMSALSANPDRY